MSKATCQESKYLTLNIENPMSFSKQGEKESWRLRLLRSQFYTVNVGNDLIN